MSIFLGVPGKIKLFPFRGFILYVEGGCNQDHPVSLPGLFLRDLDGKSDWDAHGLCKQRDLRRLAK